MCHIQLSSHNLPNVTGHSFHRLGAMAATVTENKDILTVADRCHKLLQRSLSTNKDRVVVLDTLKRKLESSHSEDNDSSFLSRVINCAVPLTSSPVSQTRVSRLLNLPWSAEIRSGVYQHSDRLWDPSHKTQSTVGDMRDGLHRELQDGTSTGRRGTKGSLRAMLHNQGIHVLMAHNGVHNCTPAEFVLVFSRLWLCVGNVFHTDNVSQTTDFLRQVREECWVSDATRAKIDAQLIASTGEDVGQPLAGATWLDGVINNVVPSQTRALSISRLPWHTDIRCKTYDASTPLTGNGNGKSISEVWRVLSSTMDRCKDKAPGKQTASGKRMVTRSRTVVKMLREMDMVPDDHRSVPCHVITDIVVRLWLRLHPEDATDALRPNDAIDGETSVRVAKRQAWWTTEAEVQDVSRCIAGGDDVHVDRDTGDNNGDDIRLQVDKANGSNTGGGDVDLLGNKGDDNASDKNGDVIAQVRGMQQNILGNWYTVFPNSQGVQFNDPASQRIDKLSIRIQGQEEVKATS